MRTLDYGEEWMIRDVMTSPDEIDDLDTMSDYEHLLENGGIDDTEEGFIRGYRLEAEV